MTKRYGSFVLRCWQLTGGEYRIEIEHVQSGDTERLDTLAAALDWLTSHIATARADAPVTSCGTPTIPEDPHGSLPA